MKFSTLAPDKHNTHARLALLTLAALFSARVYAPEVEYKYKEPIILMKNPQDFAKAFEERLAGKSLEERIKTINLASIATRGPEAKVKAETWKNAVNNAMRFISEKNLPLFIPLIISEIPASKFKEFLVNNVHPSRQSKVRDAYVEYVKQYIDKKLTKESLKNLTSYAIIIEDAPVAAQLWMDFKKAGQNESVPFQERTIKLVKEYPYTKTIESLRPFLDADMINSILKDIPSISTESKKLLNAMKEVAGIRAILSDITTTTQEKIQKSSQEIKKLTRKFGEKSKETIDARNAALSELAELSKDINWAEIIGDAPQESIDFLKQTLKAELEIAQKTIEKAVYSKEKAKATDPISTFFYWIYEALGFGKAGMKKEIENLKIGLDGIIDEQIIENESQGKTEKDNKWLEELRERVIGKKNDEIMRLIAEKKEQAQKGLKMEIQDTFENWLKNAKESGTTDRDILEALLSAPDLQNQILKDIHAVGEVKRALLSEIILEKLGKSTIEERLS